ncbi:MAG: M20/M25/M40 family metallo-hydrolase [Acidobacteriia bacterium]|nr:M20/M25/M40 family metallo-hydrolase [Terriglobia bacterium]
MRLCFLLIASLALGADDVHISADSLRGNLSFLSSDLLEGRATPSRGLDIAAEYIAGQLRRAGLEPIGDDGYFQTATMLVREQNPQGFQMTVTAGGKTVRVEAEQAAILVDKTLNLENVPIAIMPEDAAGKVVVINAPGRVAPKGAALVLFAPPDRPRPSVTDPESARPARSSVVSPEMMDLLKNAKDARVTLHVEPMIERRVKVRNVAGVLRGSDPVLRDTYVLLTAHYDHVGMRASGDDKIFNGANDDGSGTVSVIEIAQALAAMNPRPKRSIVFMTFFGEELGDVGSHYYARHPLVPLAKTVAHLNLEQLGRTDDSEGAQVAEATVTGYTFSTLTKTLVEAGKAVGVKIHDRPHTDEYFSRSDNLALAETGVPAHTLGVSFDFPDYHGVGDEWQKIDYDNMAKIDRAVALGLLRLASDAEPPKWDESVAAAKKYADAAKKLHEPAAAARR